MVVRPCARVGNEAITTTTTTKERCRAEFLGANGETDKSILGPRNDNGEDVIGVRWWNEL
jgi:hypothetical protein